MGYAGQTIVIPQQTGGYQYRVDLENIDPSMLVGESKNFNLDRDGRRKRGGTVRVNETPATLEPRILGIFDYRLPTTSYQVFGGDSGILYLDPTTSLANAMGSTKPYSFEVFGGELYVCDGETRPRVWDGTLPGSANVISGLAADWSEPDNEPFQLITHGRGTSKRLWALLGKNVYYSDLDDGEDFLNGGVIAIETGDAFGLTGGVEFGDRLIVFGKRKAFIIEDTDDSTANWGYSAAQWDGGAAHWRCIVKTPNDVMVMTEDGDIYSLSAVQSYGDYRAASIAKPAFMDVFMRETVAMQNVANFHALYDPNLRAVKWFVERGGTGVNDTALLYFIDRAPAEAWAIHSNDDYASGYGASASAIVETTGKEYVTYTGDYSGTLWKLEQDTFDDDGNPYTMTLRTPRINMGDLRNDKEFKRGLYTVTGGAEVAFTVSMYVDGKDGEDVEENVPVSGSVFDDAVFDSGQFDDTTAVRGTFDIGKKGRNISLELSHSTINQNFALQTLMLDYKVLGAGPQ